MLRLTDFYYWGVECCWLSVNKVSDAASAKAEATKLTILFVDLDEGFVRLLCSGKIVLVLRRNKRTMESIWEREESHEWLQRMRRQERVDLAASGLERSRCLSQDNGNIFCFSFQNNENLRLHKSEGLFFKSGATVVLKTLYSVLYVHIYIWFNAWCKAY